MEVKNSFIWSVTERPVFEKALANALARESGAEVEVQRLEAGLRVRMCHCAFSACSHLSASQEAGNSAVRHLLKLGSGTPGLCSKSLPRVVECCWRQVCF